MKKCAIYCTLCVLIGGYFLFKKEPIREPAEQVTHNVSIISESEMPEVLPVDGVLHVLDTLNEAGDVHINYTHSLVIDTVTHEMEYAGSTYNYDVDRGHTSLINDKFSAELWYTEDNYKLSTDRVEDLDAVYNVTKDCYQSNVQTIRLICEMIMQGKVQDVIRRNDHTVYKATSYDQLAKTDMLHVTVDSYVERSDWAVVVPDDAQGEYTAVLKVYPSENSSGITCERFSYKFRVNTGFRCEFPDK